MKTRSKYLFKIIEPKHFDPLSGQELVDAPEPQQFESPSSWLSRLALSQGTSLINVLTYLKIDIQSDIDLQVADLDIENVARICGLPVTSFYFMKHMFSQLRQIDSDGTSFLLYKNSYARYRYCPRCLSEQHTPHLPLHWRFSVWRWCPLHNTLMSDFCPRCRAVLVMPTNMIKAGHRGLGVAYLFHCNVCGSRLMNKTKAKKLKVARFRLSKEDHFLMANGRTLLAALFHTGFSIGKSMQKYQISGILGLKNQGYLPPDVMRYELNELNPKPRYRDPITNQIVQHSRSPKNIRNHSNRVASIDAKRKADDFKT